jgi:hypothetical protein
MKKLLFVLLLIINSLNANEIKNSYFIGGDYGELTITDNKNTQNYVEAKIGTYFYDPNIYLISNRVYLSGSKVLTDNSSFYTAKFNLDWVVNNIPFVKPYFGMSGGYVYFMAGSTNYSTATYGFQTGLLIYLGNNIELEVGGSTDKVTQKTDKWTSALKKVYGGINISF